MFYSGAEQMDERGDVSSPRQYDAVPAFIIRPR